MPPKGIQETLDINGLDVTVRSTGGEDDYFSLTDLAKAKSDNPKDVIKNWMRNRDTIELLGIWETLHNPDFKGVEFDTFKKQAGKNAFTMTPTKWISATKAIGIRTRNGRYSGGTFAHVDLALDFAAWISPEFRLYVFQEYKRLKQDEASRLNVEWSNRRMFASLNYRIHTDAIKETLPEYLKGTKREGITYAQEADILNIAVFGMTSREWRSAHPEHHGENIRDYASVTQNLILSNLEARNAELLREHVERDKRFEILWNIARQQEKTFEKHPTVKKLEEKSTGKEVE
ncbi:DNA-binding protein [Bifidobacterium aquikefiri]|uniref:DNA-binding protein n=2 Tax=Bifidobacterium aquikefiri TaxID=1653207 RepID=A0A261G2P7_9BIFI|nr:DNA-binding protein [Bifidobacterium aquikefiri]